MGGGQRVFLTAATVLVAASGINRNTNLVEVQILCVGTDRGAYSRAWAGRSGAAESCIHAMEGSGRIRRWEDWKSPFIFGSLAFRRMRGDRERGDKLKSEK